MVKIGCEVSEEWSTLTRRALASCRRARARLYVACQRGHAEAVRALIEQGADLNASMSDENAWATPVNVATQEGHAHLVLLLSEQGADLTGGIPNRAPPSALPRLHQTEMSLRSAAERLAPSWIASANGHLEVLRVLADRGADLSASRFAFLFTDEDRELFLHGQMRMQDHCGWAQVSFADTRGKFRAHSMRLH